MTFKEREKQLCDECHKYFKQQNRECSFQNRKLEDKCSHLQDIMYGWELGRKDTLEEIDTRTDAFIEKAKKWFEKQTEWSDPNGNRHCDLNDFEDFRNYMKGE